MIAELGHFSLITAFILSLVGATLPHQGIRTGQLAFIHLAGKTAIAAFILSLIAFLSLGYSYYISDFSVVNVATNSHTLKPLMYKLSGAWGNHEGSLLFQIMIMTLYNASIALFSKALPTPFRARVIAVQHLVIVGFMLFVLMTSNPFLRLDPGPLEGNGLNPLLQDPGLIFHPPMLYLGYIGLSVPFSFAIAALIDGHVTPLWARWVRPWALLSWIFLTIGITLGSWWAYYELGWGGWWFWDPTENASFMPWLAAAALLHSAIVVEKRGALKNWTILLAIVAFSFSLLGMFLVRSGVVVSVHSFASDPERGVFILAFLALIIGSTLSLYAWRAPSLKGGGLFATLSRESALVLNNILLSIYAAVVLIGTLYPMILEAVNGTQISVGPPFFNFATAVIMTPLILALGVGPMLAWKRGKGDRIKALIIPVLIIALLTAVVIFWITAGTSLMTGLGLMLAFYLMGSSLMEMADRVKLFKDPAKAGKRLWALPRAAKGMTLAHLGLGVILLAITVSEAWSEEKLLVMKPGDQTTVSGYTFTFTEARPIAGPNYTAVEGHFDVTKGGQPITKLVPEDRLYTSPFMNTTEAAIHPLFSGDLYAVIGESAGIDKNTGQQKFAMRLYFKPLISGIWFGVFLMVIGGFLSLTDRRLRLGTAAPKSAPHNSTATKRQETV